MLRHITILIVLKFQTGKIVVTCHRLPFDIVECEFGSKSVFNFGIIASDMIILRVHGLSIQGEVLLTHNVAIFIERIAAHRHSGFAFTCAFTLACKVTLLYYTVAVIHTYPNGKTILQALDITVIAEVVNLGNMTFLVIYISKPPYSVAVAHPLVLECGIFHFGNAPLGVAGVDIARNAAFTLIPCCVYSCEVDG